MNIKQLSQISGLTVRTLHHYDEIGLLSPEKNKSNNYREYSDQDVSKLQEILFFKELGFELKKIKLIMDFPNYTRLKSLEEHKKIIEEKRDYLNKVIENINQSIKNEKGEIVMSNIDKFKGINFNTNPYEEEARQRWGDERVDISKENINKYSSNEKDVLAEEMSNIFNLFSDLRLTDPKSKQASDLARKFYDYLNTKIGSFYNKEVFKSLGQMYVEDERFTNNLDKYGEGTAKFMSEAMAYFSDNFL